jgi:hypothetical protein
MTLVHLLSDSQELISRKYPALDESSTHTHTAFMVRFDILSSTSRYSEIVRYFGWAQNSINNKGKA